MTTKEQSTPWRSLIERLRANSVVGKQREQLTAEYEALRGQGFPEPLLKSILQWNDLMAEAVVALETPPSESAEREPEAAVVIDYETTDFSDMRIGFVRFDDRALPVGTKLYAAPQPSTATIDAAPSTTAPLKEGVGPGDAAAAAPLSATRQTDAAATLDCPVIAGAPSQEGVRQGDVAAAAPSSFDKDDELPGMLALAKGVAEQRWPHTMDAAVWAAEFVKLNPGADEGLMLSWFANAIMAGYDTAQSRNTPSASALLEMLKAARCPNCDEQGWYVVPHRNTGEPEQQQCQWCDERRQYVNDISKEKTMVCNIKVNGEGFTHLGEQISYADVLKLAGYAPDLAISVTYRAPRNGDEQRSGSMRMDQTVRVEPGMSFTAVATGSA
jgi:hypothetical protein